MGDTSETKIKVVKKRKKESDEEASPPTKNLEEVLTKVVERLDELSEKVESRDATNLVKTAKVLSMLIASDNDSSKSAGLTTGVNIATIKNQIERAIDGDITDEEVINMIDNGWFMVKGYIFGDKGFKKTIEELNKNRRQASANIADGIDGDV